MGKHVTTFASVLCFVLLTTGLTSATRPHEVRQNVLELNHHGPRLATTGQGRLAQPQAHSIGNRRESLSARRGPTLPSFARTSERSRLNPMVSPKAEIYVIDTSTVVNNKDTTRYIYEHNSFGRISSESVKKLVNGQWVDSSRSTRTFDLVGNMLSELYELWSGVQWVNDWRYTLAYDANGRLSTEVQEEWTNGLWVNSWRYTVAYDATERFLSEVAEQWTAGQWVNVDRNTYTFDTMGNELSSLSEQWTNGQWMNTTRYTYTYDASGNELTLLYEHWTNGLLDTSVRYTLTYDAGGRFLSELEEELTDSLWTNAWRYTDTYDASGRMLSELDEEWMDSVWVNAWRYTYTHDVSGNQLSELEEDWTGSLWANSWRFAKTYTPNGYIATAKYEIWQGSLWVPVNSYLDLSDGSYYYFYYYGSSFTFVYELITTGVRSDNDGIPFTYSLSQNYPNPFNPSTTISFSISSRSVVSLKLYDLLGKEVATIYSGELPAGNYTRQWNASDLTSGVYFYRVQAGSFSQTKKLVLLK